MIAGDGCGIVPHIFMSGTEHNVKLTLCLLLQDAWRKRVVEACKAHPSMCVETLGKRRRYLQNINSKNSGLCVMMTCY